MPGLRVYPGPGGGDADSGAGSHLVPYPRGVRPFGPFDPGVVPFGRAFDAGAFPHQEPREAAYLLVDPVAGAYPPLVADSFVGPLVAYPVEEAYPPLV